MESLWSFIESTWFIDFAYNVERTQYNNHNNIDNNITILIITTLLQIIIIIDYYHNYE